MTGIYQKKRWNKGINNPSHNNVVPPIHINTLTLPNYNILLLDKSLVLVSIYMDGRNNIVVIGIYQKKRWEEQRYIWGHVLVLSSNKML